MRRLYTDVHGERSVQVERRDGRVADIDDVVIGAGKLTREITHCRRLADAGLGGEQTDTGVLDELSEATSQSHVARCLVEEGFPLCALWKWIGREAESIAVGHVIHSLSVGDSSSPSLSSCAAPSRRTR